MNTNTEPKSPKEQALHLLADYASAQAALKAAIAPHEAEAAKIHAAITKATAAEKARLEDIEEQLKKLALEHGHEIFGEDRRSLAENGYILGLRETAAVEVDDEDAAVRMLRADAQIAPSEAAKLACNACLRITVALDREYILRHHDEAPDWFAQYGIQVRDKVSASVKPAPKPRTAKSKASKKTPAEAKPEQEAA